MEKKRKFNTGYQHFPFSYIVIKHGVCVVEITHYQMTNFRLFSKLKELADNNFRFDENGRKLYKRVENTVGKGEIAGYEQFLIFPQCFQKACFPGASKGVTVWEWGKTDFEIPRLCLPE